MVKVILGDKGSGNTKELMKTIGEALAQDQGSIVCIEKGNDLTYDVSHEVRLISAVQAGNEALQEGSGRGCRIPGMVQIGRAHV